MEPKILKTEPSADYELLDSGEEEKLERYGTYVLRRPDPQALWKKSLPDSEWKKADGTFFRDELRKGWKKKEGMPDVWQIAFGDIKFNIKPSAFKHTGVFPEQQSNWEFIKSKINGKSVKVLNLFGYTGGATLAALSAGAEVVHVDGSKATVELAKENAQISGLDKKPVRWIIDDARKFVMREIKRGGKYDGIIMDPPSFGRGGKGEIWKIEENFLPLIEQCSKILSDNPFFFLINGYAAGYSSQAYYNALEPIMGKYGGKFEIGELTIEEKSSKRLLPCGIFVRWSKV